MANSMKLHADQITAEIIQTYDLLKNAAARSKNTTRSALYKQDWSDIKGQETEKKTANVQMLRTVGVM